MKSLILAFLLVLMTFPVFAANDEGKESAFDRVMRTGVLRCGYYVFPPVTYRDPKTDALSGFSVDMMNRIGERAGLKIEWTEEVTFGNWVPALQSRRFDAVCTPMWPEIPMGRAVAFSIPMFYSGLYPMVKVDDLRFAKVTADFSRLNQPDVTFVAQEGNVLDTITREAFPNAKVVSVSASVDGPTMMQEIATGKADVVLMDHNGLIEYNRNNPVKMKLLDAGDPVKVQSFTLVVGREEMVLKDFLDNAILELQYSGVIDRLLTKWESQPGLFLRPSSPFRKGKSN
jgi:ABC-type amino acid transport substrate-binding protein